MGEVTGEGQDHSSEKSRETKKDTDQSKTTGSQQQAQAVQEMRT
jgi:hypothetical protein